MTRYDRLMARVAGGERILIDGATGTEIERRGVPQLDKAWNGGGALSHPDILRQVHLDYIHAGAEMVISNTFSTHLHALQDAGVADRFADYNTRAVELALEAVAQSGRDSVLVAGGMSYWSWSGRLTTAEDIGAPAARQAGFMAKAGADLIVLEMMVDIARMEVTLDAALTAGAPVWVGLSCEPDEAGQMCLLNRDPLAQAVAFLKTKPIDVIAIMHTEVEYVAACLDVVRAGWSGPVCVYAHSARWENHKTIFDGTISAKDYADHAAGWVAQGAKIIGGCCGMGVDHIKALRPVVASA
ncbi:MAG: homocysteine S-methyltransferase family protein [Pseudomonadota bacterium]